MRHEPFDKDAFLRVTSNTDAWLRLAGVMNEAELEQAVTGVMNVYVVLSFELQRRYPAAFERHAKEIDERPDPPVTGTT